MADCVGECADQGAAFGLLCSGDLLLLAVSPDMRKSRMLLPAASTLCSAPELSPGDLLSSAFKSKPLSPGTS